MLKKALTIAGSDSGGGAGIQADLKTFSALGVYGMSVITSVTAQNTTGVTAVEDISAEVVGKQIDAVFSDIEVDAVKIGMVSNSDIIEIIAEKLKKWEVSNIVLDPVMISESGSYLLQKDARQALINDLFPLVDLVTPNLYEAAALLEREIVTIEDMEEAAVDLFEFGSKAVLVKGGHLENKKTDISGRAKKVPSRAVDIYYDGESIHRYEADRIETRNTHGTGCTYSSAIASYLAFGFELKEAIKKAKKYITAAIKYSIDIGEGPGPTNHFYKLWSRE
ncbi:MAG: bifunctional hydroxymethylpyrimidine kinase/phosphomethylpyrimidine kinase [Halanaerobiales bacterium]